MVVPATIISTAIGSINGYVLSKWRFHRFGNPFWPDDSWRLHARPDGSLALGSRARLADLTNSTSGLVLSPLCPRIKFYHALFPQLLRQYSGRSHQGGADRWCRFLADFSEDHPAAVTAHFDRNRDLAVHQHLERISLRGHLFFGHSSTDHCGADRAQCRGNFGPPIQYRKRRRADCRFATAPGLFLWRPIFSPRTDARAQSSNRKTWLP